jgi:uncharacterized lipoprotein YmbA
MKTFTTVRRFARLSVFSAPLVSALALAAVLAGCSVLPQPVEDPTRYYLLSSDSSIPPEQTGGASSEQRLRLALKPVEMPGYLRNNRTLVVRNGVNEIRYQDYARWAEPLDGAVQRIVREKLLAKGAISSVEVGSFPGDSTRDFDVSIRVFRCEGGVDATGKKSAQFGAVYEISDPKNGGRIVLRKNYLAPETEWDGANYAALAQRLSEAVGALADDIAASLPR